MTDTFDTKKAEIQAKLKNKGFEPKPNEADQSGLFFAFEDGKAPSFAELANVIGDFFDAGQVVDLLPNAAKDVLKSTRLKALSFVPSKDGVPVQFSITLDWGPYRIKEPVPFHVKLFEAKISATGSFISAELTAKKMTLFDADLAMDVSASLPAMIFKAELQEGQADGTSADKVQSNVAGHLSGAPGFKKDALKLTDLKVIAAVREPRVVLHLAIANLVSFDHLKVAQTELDLIYTGGRAGGVTGAAWTTLAIPFGKNTGDELDIIIKGEIKKSGWSLLGATVPDREVAIGDLITAIADAFNDKPPLLPTALKSLKLEQIGFNYVSNPRSFTFNIEVAFQTAPTDPTVDIRLSYTGDMGKMKLTGIINIGGYEFDLAFEKKRNTSGQVPTSETYLLGAFQPPKGKKQIQLKKLVGALSPAVANDLPEVDLSLQDVLFAYASRSDRPKASSTLFALALALDIDLTKIPVIGNELKQFQPLGISSLQAIYASKPVSLPSATEINAILDSLSVKPTLPLPPPANAPAASNKPANQPQALNAGLNFAATLDLPKGKYTLLSGSRGAKPSGRGAADGGNSPAIAKNSGAATGSGTSATAAASNATWIDVQTKIGPLMIQKLGGRYANKRVWLLLSGSLAAGPMALDVQGLGVGFKLKLPPLPKFSLDGLGLSYTAGPIQMTGVFLKTQAPVYDANGKKTDQTVTQYAGEVRIQAEVVSLVAVGAYGQMASGDPTVFIYGALGAEDGAGIVAGPIMITGVALGFGINRRVLVPKIEQVSRFPMVTLVMGQPGGGSLLGAPAQNDAAQLLAEMSNVLPAQQGQYFGAIGLRFALFETIDCFALAIVQGGRSLEIAVIGIGRFRKPDVGNPLCYIELDILLDIKPDAGILKLEALLANSWVLDPGGSITGGFALYIWYGGEHKGDFVITLGGYHPRFVKPAHYPTVPRLGFNWQVSDKLIIKGGSYFAITPSTFMAGGRLEASFRTSIVGADFVAYADFLIQWKPLYYDIDMGISVRAYADLWLFTIHVSLSADLLIQGPPMHGTAKLKVGAISVTVRFGDQPDKPPYIEAWPEFGRAFLDRTAASGKAANANDDKPTGKWALPSGRQASIAGPNLHQLNLLKGEVTNANKPKEDTRWFVRGDEIEFAIASVVPISDLQIGNVAPKSGFVLPPDSDSGKPLTVASPIQLDGNAQSKTSKHKFALRPMNHNAVQTTTRVTVIAEKDNESLVEVEKWAVDVVQSAVPAAIWGEPIADGSTPEPSAKTVPNSITGVRRLKPPTGGTIGGSIGPIKAKKLGWDDLLPHKVVELGTAVQTVAEKSAEVAPNTFAHTAPMRETIAAALFSAGFAEAHTFKVSQSAPRLLYAAPLQGAVATVKQI